MKKIIKQIVGIDVAKDELVVCLGKMLDDWTPELFASKSFANSAKGILSLIEWVKKLMDEEITVRFVMEATGVYHEHLAYHLDEDGFEVSIVLPNKISNYARTLDVKTVTDKTASEAITRFGLERNLDRWTRPNGLLKKLRQLTRERGQLLDERTVIKNQIHAERSEAEPSKKAEERMNKRILLLNKQENEIMDELKDLIKTDQEMQKLVVLLCSIPGIGFLTAVTVLGETNGFELIRNKRQLTSYAGLDIKEKQSGTSVYGKPKISKRGNKYLRKAMHLPALTAIKHDERFKGIFARLVSKHGIKMKAAVAVQRKLLEMTYTVYKTGKPYEKDYFNLKSEEIVQEKN
jgi:transposase